MKWDFYRAMSEEEFRILREQGFEATFRRAWKYFSTDPRYIAIVVNELNYGACPEVKYSRVAKFEIRFRKGAEKFMRFFRERGFLNVAMHKNAVTFIEEFKWKELKKDKLPEPKPVLIWVSRKGRIVKVYSEKKAKEILTNMGSGVKRILFINHDKEL